MPWIEGNKENPSYYAWPKGLSDDTVLGRNIEYAKSQRKIIGQLREEIIGFQKACDRNDIEGARFFSVQAADLMKQYRGWDGAIKVIEDEYDWMHRHISEQIAPYVDQAFLFMEYLETER